MKIQLRSLLYENFLQDGYDHVKRNVGKYALGANAAGVYAAGQGYLGDGAKNLYDKASDKISSTYNRFRSNGGQNPQTPQGQGGQHHPEEHQISQTHQTPQPHHDLDLDDHPLTESDNAVLKHLKDNAGKYVAGEAALLGGTYAAGKGYLGVGPQDAVQDFVGNQAAHLENLAHANHLKGSKDAFHEIYSRPDNIFAGEHERQFTSAVQNALQKEHYIGDLQDGAASALRGIGNMNNVPDTINYAIRNPGDTVDHHIGHLALATKALMSDDDD